MNGRKVSGVNMIPHRNALRSGLLETGRIKEMTEEKQPAFWRW